jgi:triacylglycerol lipase
LVFVSGTGRNDKSKIVRPWGRIPGLLQDRGVAVYAGNTDAWGDIESNAELLKKTVDYVLEDSQKSRVNIICHSKGGIDARYMIWKYNYGNKIASLTTISTPHQGAEVADLIFNSRLIHTDKAKKRLQLVEQLYKDDNPNMYKVSYQLTSEHMKEFNDNVIHDERVYFQSIYTTMHDSFNDRRFAVSFKYITKVSGANDGLVSEKSVKWGSNTVKIWGNISHEQILDQHRHKYPGMAIPNIYLEIVNELANMGF